MKLKHGLHLAYCTNIHRGETWDETWQSLKKFTLKVRDRVSPEKEYAIGLRLSDQASRELMVSDHLESFKSWLKQENLYVFTINGFPFGKFHGTRIKEQVYLPDWSSPERLDYTVRLFTILSRIVPDGVDGSVSTLPGSFKRFNSTPAQKDAIFENLEKCAQEISKLEDQSGRRLHLGLEPEPLGLFETTSETIDFISDLRRRSGDPQLISRIIGVNYDTCHLAVEFEQPAESLEKFERAGILISKIHLSSALKVMIDADSLKELEGFADDVYLHQVIRQEPDGSLIRFLDLPDAIADWKMRQPSVAEEWRIHFHVPLHSPETSIQGTTSGDLRKTLDYLQQRPGTCSHLEMETYTWEVLPPDLKKRDVVDQLVSEYQWALAEFHSRGLA